MIDLGLYNRLHRNNEELIKIGIEDCNTILSDGYITVSTRPYGVDIRFYTSIPNTKYSKLYNYTNGILKREVL